MSANPEELFWHASDWRWRMVETLESDSQRAAVHRQGFQRVHSDLGNDARPNLAVYTQPYGKIERWHKSLKGECMPLSLDDARRLVSRLVADWAPYIPRLKSVQRHENSVVNY